MPPFEIVTNSCFKVCVQVLVWNLFLVHLGEGLWVGLGLCIRLYKFIRLWETLHSGCFSLLVWEWIGPAALSAGNFLILTLPWTCVVLSSPVLICSHKVRRCWAPVSCWPSSSTSFSDYCWSWELIVETSEQFIYAGWLQVLSLSLSLSPVPPPHTHSVSFWFFETWFLCVIPRQRLLMLASEMGYGPFSSGWQSRPPCGSLQLGDEEPGR